MSSSADSSVAIRVSDVSKVYHVYDQPLDRLKQSLLPRIHRLFGMASKTYCRDFVSLDSVSFEVSKGETVGIIGRNGAGKSTLLQVICGTLAPTTGQVEVNGKVAALLELGAGFNPEFTGRENVYMNASILGLTEDQIDERYQSIVDFADIGDYLDQPVKTYSSGMYVRLAFAVIAHVDADILVIDEALAVGDVFFTQKCMRFLRRFMEKGTVLFVSHDTASVKSFCQSAILLNNGCVQMQADAKTVAEYYLEELYRERQDVDGAKELRPSVTGKVKTVIDKEGDKESVRQGNGSFGAAGAEVISVDLRHENGVPVMSVAGLQPVELSVSLSAHTPIKDVIVGFLVRDRLGQEVFGENTTLGGNASGKSVDAGVSFQAIFAFDMPSLPAGDYTITVAVADGSLSDNIQHHWIHDAVAFKSLPDNPVYGMIGVPMKSIEVIS